MLVIAVWIGASVVMVFGWLHQKKTRNTGIVDVLWSACMAVSAVVYAVLGSGAALPRSLVGVLGGIWGVRLAWHIARRVANEPEDGRYRYLREHWNDSQARLFAFFMAQGLAVALFSLPFWIASSNPQMAWTAWSTLAVAIWLVSVLGEAIADAQLARFRADKSNRDKTCRAGLWKYSRHPNYFFEFTHWFAYCALCVGAPTWLVAVSLIGPALMLVSLYWITGIPYTEAQAVRSRGDDYREYQATTSVLIPWFPRKPSGASSH